ncbi:hypothetical protein GMOD_00002508 [Pyrenophora seminiperda CCB06]|uniref:Uncharacterized protein n=1 Tax=Pyrenophora seminiperda CCB06 TaxID=1302712 RepID=A0A3M7M2J7_9PLEO|nr:hypothetical protein GMOD_00002508 [Pyrenophora seminiperda CCB06]
MNRRQGFYALNAGQLVAVMDAHDALQQYCKSTCSFLGEGMRKLSQEVRDMIYDYVLPAEEILIDEMHCGAVALRVLDTKEWINLHQYKCLGNDIVFELVIALYRTRTFVLGSFFKEKKIWHLMSDFLAKDTYGMDVSPAKLVSKVIVLIERNCYMELVCDRVCDRAPLATAVRAAVTVSLEALKVMQHPACVLTIKLHSSWFWLPPSNSIRICRPGSSMIHALHSIVGPLGRLITRHWKIRLHLLPHWYDPDWHEPDRNCIVLTEKDAGNFNFARTEKETVGGLQDFASDWQCGSRERAYWALWLAGLPPNDDTVANAQVTMNGKIPEWVIASKMLRDTMDSIIRNRYPIERTWFDG